MNPVLRWAIAVLMAGTIFRAQTVLFLPDLQMFGGIALDGWFGPWLSDTIIGFALPVMLYLFWTRRSVTVWGALVAYNAVGAFDYSQGLITQAISPMPVEMASAATVYVGIGLFMCFQLVALGLLFRRDVIVDFKGGKLMDGPVALTKDVTIAVFGATGRTGRHVVCHALGDAHRAPALARDPGRVSVEDDIRRMKRSASELEDLQVARRPEGSR